LSALFIMEQFKPAWWLSNPHLQTIYPTLFRKSVHIKLNKERLETADNDFLDIAYPDDNGGNLVLIFHGLEGSLDSHYAKGMIKALHDAGLQPVFMHFRGCSGEINRTTRRYNAADSLDAGFLMATLRERFPGRDINAIGFSLGANMLLKWLNQMGKNSPIKKAVAISVPFDLAICDKRLRLGVSRFYLKHLLKELHDSIRRKHEAGLFPADYEKAIHSKTFWEFDEYATAPLHGFSGADDYYAKCSSKFYMKNIHTPTLIIQAADDPFLTPKALPKDSDMSPAVSLELSKKGGHVGFITGAIPFRPEYWLEKRTVAFLKS
jgi:predicted alpha/beta-fold hydrolase